MHKFILSLDRISNGFILTSQEAKDCVSIFLHSEEEVICHIINHLKLTPADVVKKSLKAKPIAKKK